MRRLSRPGGPKTAPRRACKKCTTRTESISGLCHRHRPQSPAKRPERPCVECGKRTTAISGMCRMCTDLADVARDAAVERPPFDRLALDGGTWHRRPGGIWVWVAWDGEALGRTG